MLFYNIKQDWYILRSDRGADGEINLASFFHRVGAVRRRNDWGCSSTPLNGVRLIVPTLAFTHFIT
jgi:hypothetical protein